MEKYIYDTHKNEKLTEVRVNKAWLDKDLMSNNSAFKDIFPAIWVSIQYEVDVEYRAFPFEFHNLKKLILSALVLFILVIKTESFSSSGGIRIGHRAYLSNGNTFKIVNWLMGFTNLVGCRFQIIHPPYEDFVNEFLGEVYF